MITKPLRLASGRAWSLAPLCALLFAAPAAAETPADLVAAAEAEGQVVVYSFTSRVFRVETAFEEAYPGIDLVPFDISSTEQIARIQAELGAGIQSADVAYLADAPVVFEALVEPGHLLPFVPPGFAERIPDAFETPLLAHRLSTKVLMYNEEAHPDGPPVDNLWQLTTEDWTGRVIMVDPSTRGDYLDLLTEIVLQSDAMAAAYEAQFGAPITLDADIANAGEQFIKDLLDNDVVFVASTDDVNVAVGAVGQENPPIGFTSYSDRRDNAEEGWALQVANAVAPAPGIIYPAFLGVLSNAPHPNAAELLITFLMGDESDTGGPALAPFYVPGDYLTRTDLAPHPDAIPLDDFNAWRIAPQATAALRQDVADLVLSLQ